MCLVRGSVIHDIQSSCSPGAGLSFQSAQHAVDIVVSFLRIFYSIPLAFVYLCCILFYAHIACCWVGIAVSNYRGPEIMDRIKSGITVEAGRLGGVRDTSQK